MKKIVVLAIISLLFSGLSLKAAPVPRERALEIGKKILAAQPPTKAGSGRISIVWDGEEVATKSTLPPAFYVVARDGGGFVIIAGDDNATPVLALSDRNEFKVEEMPANVKWWMDRMKAYVRSLNSQSPEAAAQWSGLVSTKGMVDDGTNVDVLASHLTPEWGQGFLTVDYYGTIIKAPLYNAKCPVDAAGDTTITGCVATALAEILTAQSAIEGVTIPSPKGTVGGYVPSSGVAPAAYSLNGHSYNWSYLQSVKNWQNVFFSYLAWFNDSATNPEIEDLWQLMADLGAIVKAEYSTTFTGALSDYVPCAMAEHFGFNPDAHLENANQYSPGRWVSMLQNEISRRPVLYSGYSPVSGGHAFVFDAYGTYQGNDVFHVNFGWNGSCNGYYYYYDLDVGTYGDFANNTSAIFDFYPVSSSYEPTGKYSYRLSFSNINDQKGFDIPASIPVGSPFTLTFGTVMNTGNAPYVGELVPALVKRTTGEVIQIDGGIIINPAIDIGTGYSNLHMAVNIPSEVGVSFGDKIVIMYSCDNSDPHSKYAILSYPRDGSFIGELPVFPMSFIATEESYHVGDYFTFALKNNSCLYAKSLWTITRPDGTTVDSIPQSRGTFQLTQSGKYQIKVDVKPDESSSVIETIVTYITVAP